MHPDPVTRQRLEAEYPERDEKEGEADDGEIEVEVGDDVEIEVEVGKDLLVSGSGRALEDGQVMLKSSLYLLTS